MAAPTSTPSDARLFEREHTVGPAEVGPEGDAHLDAIARWLQDVAFQDVLDAGLHDSAAWIVRRTAIRIAKPPRFVESLQVQTRCSGLAKSVAERRTSIAGAAGARVEAEAIWVQVDPETRMPARFSDEFLAVYGPSASGRRPRTRLRHEAPPGDCERLEWRFREADIDLAGHVNNAVYWQIAEQHLPAPRAGSAIEIEFRGGTGAGPATLLRRAEMVWVLDGAGAVAASIAASPPASGTRRAHRG